MTLVITRTGACVDLLRPDPATLRLADMAWHGARIARWAGATIEPVSVARHSIWVADHVPPEARPWALFHDLAHETYIGDIVAPAVTAFESAVGIAGGLVGAAVSHIRARFDITVRDRFGILCTLEIKGEVNAADLAVRAAEARDFLFDPPEDLIRGAVLTDLRGGRRSPERDAADWLAYVRHALPHLPDSAFEPPLPGGLAT